MDLATAELRSLSLYRNGSKAGNIPRDKLSTKISGLAIDTEYTFHLVLRTSAGTYSSEKLAVRTQKMTDLTGVTVTPGVMPASLRDSLAEAVGRIGAKLIDTVRIDTTHFVCTEGRGQAWEKALEMNVPVVVPDWVLGCEREGRIVGVRGYYLNADPKLRQVGPGMQMQGMSSQSSLPVRDQQQQQQQSQSQSQSQEENARRSGQQTQGPLKVQPPLPSPRIEHTPPTPEQMRRGGGGGGAGPQQSNGARRGSEEPPTPPPKMNASSAAAEPEVTSIPEEEPQSQAEKEEETTTTATKDEAAAATAAPAENRAETETEETEAEGNNLKAIGIPHESQEADKEAPPRTTPAANEEGFDEVDL